MAMKQPVKEIQAFINYDENVISDSDDLISFKISCDSGLCKTAMRKLEAQFLGGHNLLGKWVKVGFGVRLPEGDFDLIDYGSFLVTEMTETKDTGTTSIVAYDKMVNSMVSYQKLDIEYPIDLLSYTKKLCEACNLELKNILPNEYQEVEYIESTGTQFIDTGVIANQNTGFDIVFLTKNSISYTTTGDTVGFGAIMGARIYSSNNELQLTTYNENNLNFQGVLRFDNKNHNAGITVNTKMHITLKNQFYTNNIDVSYPLESEFNSQNSLVLFALNENGAKVQNGLVQIYNLKLYDGDILVRDYVPCYRKADNVIGMYDLVNNVFYTNGGTGEFIKGADTNTYTDALGIGNMDDWQITATKDADGNLIDLWENIDGITYRDIFTQIAQATASTCIIHDDKVYFKPLTDTGESLTYENMFKLKLEALYGEINSVVLSRAQIEGEIVSLQNDASIQANGLTEFKIESNEIIDKDRETAITPIFDALNGVSYYPFEATTEGLGWYEIGDNITIVNDLGEEFKTSLFNYSITIDGSVKETLKTTAESKTQSQYQYANTISKQIRNTEIIVNKQEQTIKAIVSDMDGVNERFSSIEQDIENINFNVQNSGGSNLIKNSVMFAYEGENTDVKSVANWTVEDDGTLTIISDVDLQTSGGISAHGFSLSNKIVRTEKIPVKPFDENDPIYYSFSTKVKKDTVGGWYVKIYNEDVGEEHILPLEEDETTNLKEYELSALKPLGDYYIIEFYGSADSNVIFTDNMLVIGEQKSQWTQANGEVMNTQVNISLDGILVRSDTVLGDYTVISKYEFAGYSNINGTMTKVFTLNKGRTEVQKLLVKESLEMPPLRVVAVNSGDLQGWAFVLA